tara:strand:- start:2014 stop:2577 length:564 start_codon:yes stop_codon:yes gene_type:complete
METINTTTQTMENTLENNIKEFLHLIGEDPSRPGLIDTPKRVAKAWAELMSPERFNTTTFDSEGYDQMIVEKDIVFYTFCEHHLLPFFGTVSIGYVPDDKIIGLSKLPRTVDYYSRRLNTQEYFTNNIAAELTDILHPLGLAIVTKGRHMCQEMRGIKKRGEMITSSMSGVFMDKIEAREEFMRLIK